MVWSEDKWQAEAAATGTQALLVGTGLTIRGKQLDPNFRMKGKKTNPTLSTPRKTRIIKPTFLGCHGLRFRATGNACSGMSCPENTELVNHHFFKRTFTAVLGYIDGFSSQSPQLQSPKGAKLPGTWESIRVPGGLPSRRLRAGSRSFSMGPLRP